MSKKINSFSVQNFKLTIERVLDPKNKHRKLYLIFLGGAGTLAAGNTIASIKKFSDIELLDSVQIVLMICCLIVFIADFYQKFFVRDMKFDSYNHLRRRVLKSVSLFTESCSSDHPAFGGVVQVHVAPIIPNVVKSCGIDPNQIKTPRPQRLILSDIFERPLLNDTHNRKKYTLVDFVPDRIDAPRWTFILRETDYNECMSFNKILSGDNYINQRHSQFGIFPKDNGIPNAFCLHGIVEFSDGSILASKRSGNLDWYSQSWSLSFEEQLSDSDFEQEGVNVAEAWTRRSVCEEIFPLRTVYQRTPSEAWNEVAAYFDYIKFCSIIFDEANFCYSAVVFLKLNISSKRYEELYEYFKLNFKDSRDPEGDLYTIGLKEQRNIIDGNFAHDSLEQSVVQNFSEALKVGTSVREEVIKLHPSSLYRLILVDQIRTNSANI